MSDASRLNNNYLKQTLFAGYLLIIMFIAPQACFSNTYSTRAWSNILYNTHFSSNPDWLYGFFLEGRFDTQPGLFYQALVQGQFGYKTSSTTRAWMGSTWIPTTIVGETGRLSTNIQRLYQQFDLDILKSHNYELASRSRLEERHRTGEDEISLVYRQLLAINMPKLIFKNKYIPFLSNELFLNLNKPLWSNQKHVDQNRLLLGWLFSCGEHKCQVAYLNQFLISKNNNQINNIIYFSLII